MNLKPLVSVCIQTYNHGNFIRECLDSVLAQKTSFPFEIVLGEDHSKDDTRSICQEYAEKYPDQIRLFLRRREDVIYINGNPTGRYNLMQNLAACRGTYIAMVEGDDFWCDPLKLQKQIDALEGDPLLTGSFHNTYYVLENNPEAGKIPWRLYDKQRYTLADTCSKVSLLHTSSFVFLRTALQLPSWFPKIQSADMALFALVASKGDLIRIDDYMSVYRKNDTGITNAIRLQNYHRNRIELMQCFKKEFDSKVHPKINDIITFHQQELKKLKRENFKNKLRNFLKPKGNG